MDKCLKCSSLRVASVTAKCGDLFNVYLLNRKHEGYVPEDFGIGGGDYLHFSYCLDCGMIQSSDFPLEPTELEEDGEGDDE